MEDCAKQQFATPLLSEKGSEFHDKKDLENLGDSRWGNREQGKATTHERKGQEDSGRGPEP